MHRALLRSCMPTHRRLRRLLRSRHRRRPTRHRRRPLNLRRRRTLHHRRRRTRRRHRRRHRAHHRLTQGHQTRGFASEKGCWAAAGLARLGEEGLESVLLTYDLLTFLLTVATATFTPRVPRGAVRAVAGGQLSTSAHLEHSFQCSTTGTPAAFQPLKSPMGRLEVTQLARARSSAP